MIGAQVQNKWNALIGQKGNAGGHPKNQDEPCTGLYFLKILFFIIFFYLQSKILFIRPSCFFLQFSFLFLRGWVQFLYYITCIKPFGIITVREFYGVLSLYYTFFYLKSSVKILIYIILRRRAKRPKIFAYAKFFFKFSTESEHVFCAKKDFKF